MPPRVFIASRQAVERSALRVLMPTLDTQVVGEAADWFTILVAAPPAQPDVVVMDWNIMIDAQHPDIERLRHACTSTIFVILASLLDARQQNALIAGADIVVDKDDAADQVVDNLRRAIAGW